MSNPFSRQENFDALSKRFAFDIAIVEQVEATANHSVLCHLRSEAEAKFVAPVLAPSNGDINLPNVNDLVLIGYSKAGQAFVLGTLYGREDTAPEHELGDRRIGHENTDSSVIIKSNGDIHINTDGNVVINGGTDNPVTDVTTTKNGDGYVTSISLVKATNVFM